MVQGEDPSTIETDFARKIIVPGTNQSKWREFVQWEITAKKGQPFRLALTGADYCDNSAER